MSDQPNVGATSETTQTLKIIHIFHSHFHSNKTDMIKLIYDGQMIFGDLVGLNLPDIWLAGEGKPRKNLTLETCPGRGSNPGPLRDRRACYRLLHIG